MEYEDYESIRYKLFAESYIAFRLVRHLRSKYGLSETPKENEWQDLVIKRHFDRIESSIFFQNFDYEKEENPVERGLRLRFAIDDVSTQMTPEISKLAEELNISATLLRVYVLYDNVPKKLGGKSRIFMANQLSPITERGFYIKVDRYTRQKDVVSAFKGILEQLKFVKIDSRKSLVQHRRRQDIAPDDLSLKIPIVQAIENEMIQLSREKSEGSEDYNRELVSGAIERVAGEKLDPDEDSFDSELQKLITQYSTWYYEITSRYRIPTPKRLQGILGLISS